MKLSMPVVIASEAKQPHEIRFNDDTSQKLEAVSSARLLRRFASRNDYKAFEKM
jgi:hypothetical protein